MRKPANEIFIVTVITFVVRVPLLVEKKEKSDFEITKASVSQLDSFSNLNT